MNENAKTEGSGLLGGGDNGEHERSDRFLCSVFFLSFLLVPLTPNGGLERLAVRKINPARGGLRDLIRIFVLSSYSLIPYFLGPSVFSLNPSSVPFGRKNSIPGQV